MAASMNNTSLWRSCRYIMPNSRPKRDCNFAVKTFGNRIVVLTAPKKLKRSSKTLEMIACPSLVCSLRFASLFRLFSIFTSLMFGTPRINCIHSLGKCLRAMKIGENKREKINLILVEMQKLLLYIPGYAYI